MSWTNSDFGTLVGIGAALAALGFAFNGIHGCHKRYPEITPPQQYVLQEADLNNNGILDKFYTIDNKIAVVELDGKLVSELYKK